MNNSIPLSMLNPVAERDQLATRPVSPRAEERRGFTLVEVMISAIVLSIALMGFLGTLVQAYRLEERARCRDQARAVLQSFADDFLRMPVTGAGGVELFFQGSIGPTGDGLNWPGAVATAAGLTFPLGSETGAPIVTITRWVQNMNEPTGVPDSVVANSSAIGREIYGEFTATYTVNRRVETLTISVVRTQTSGT